jgi:hypothetical protein
MAIKDLIARLFGPIRVNQGNGLPFPRLGESRPSGHFREFTVPRRYQRGGGSGSRSGSDAWCGRNGIVPCAGENIP